MTQDESEAEIRRLTETLDELLEHVGATRLDEAVEKLAAERAAHEHDAGTIDRLRRERDEARAGARSAHRVIAVLAKRAGGRIDITRAEVLALHPHGVLRDVCEGLAQPGLRLTYEEPAGAR